MGARWGQDAGELVVVVVGLGGGFAVVRAEDAAGVLDEPSLLGDGRSEEDGCPACPVEQPLRAVPERSAPPWFCCPTNA
jgi:hypothetical protein